MTLLISIINFLLKFTLHGKAEYNTNVYTVCTLQEKIVLQTVVYNTSFVAEKIFNQVDYTLEILNNQLTKEPLQA